MRTLNTKEISDCVYRLARKAGVTLTPACHAALESARNFLFNPVQLKERTLSLVELQMPAHVRNETFGKLDKFCIALLIVDLDGLGRLMNHIA